MKIEKTDPIYRMKYNRQFILFIILVPLAVSFYAYFAYRDLAALFVCLSVTIPLSIFLLLCLIKKAVLTKHFLVVKGLFSRKRIAYGKITKLKKEMEAEGSLAPKTKQLRIYDENGSFAALAPKDLDGFYLELRKRMDAVKEQTNLEEKNEEPAEEFVRN